MTEFEIVRKSNTIFSTMVCPVCGSPFHFYAAGDLLGFWCQKDVTHFNDYLNSEDLSVLLNNNINSLVYFDKK